MATTDQLPSPNAPARDSDECCTRCVGGAPAAPKSDAAGRSFDVSGLDCAEEVAILRRTVGPLVGNADRLAFDVLNGRMTVLDATDSASDEAIVAAVARTGMSARRSSPGKTPEDKGRFGSQKLLTTASGVSLLAGLLVQFLFAGGVVGPLALLAGQTGTAPQWTATLLYLAAIGFGVRYVAPKAWFAARSLRPDMNLLMVIAVTGAVLIGELFEGATVAFLFALSLLLESWSVGRARDAVSALLDLAPDTVRLVNSDGTERDALAADVPLGARFVVRGGDRIALDGRVVDGAGSVDQAPITGESVPVLKEVGADVYAGTINGEGTLTIEATKPADDTVLARIIRMVGEAHSRRAPSEQWVERFARIYTPAVMVLAILVLLVPPLAFAAPWETSIYNALVLLVIACPCALVISTPVSIVAALASAARNGVLIKGGVFVEMPARIKALALDKTGTLTLGEPEVTEIIPLNGATDREVLALGAALEARSSHPLAHAILRRAEADEIAIAPATDVTLFAGKGLTGTVDGRALWLGSARYASERGTLPDANAQTDALATIVDRIAALEGQGRTVVVLGDRHGPSGLIALADTIRPQARGIIERLHRAGVKQIIMLTGDNAATARTVADELGIDEVRAELLPEDKVAAVEALANAYGTVAMIGDGVNDAPAMARADLAIAMGAIGSDAAIETADVALMTDELSRIPWLIHHSRHTLGVIRQNIAFSLGVKLVFVALTAWGLASLWGAIAADVGATLLVVANALRLLRASVKDRPNADADEASTLTSACRQAGA
ncbi:MAG: heavy metal translocating P-type ATPase [Acuticoccus sp.]